MLWPLSCLPDLRAVVIPSQAANLPAAVPADGHHEHERRAALVQLALFKKVPAVLLVIVE